MKSGYDGELSFVIVCKVIIMTTNVIEKINNMCISTIFGYKVLVIGIHLMTENINKKVEISYKVNMGSNWYGIFLKYIIGVPTWCGKKDPPCWD